MIINILLAFSGRFCFFRGTKLVASFLKISAAFHLGGYLPNKFGSSPDEYVYPYILCTHQAPMIMMYHGPLTEPTILESKYY